MGIAASQPMCTVEDLQGKGRGLVATRNIPKGTRIVAEKSLVTLGQPIASAQQLEDCIHEQVSSLSKVQLTDFLSMANVYPYTSSAERYCGIFRTNSLPMPERDAGGIFSQACRINHACDPNAQNYWNDYNSQLTIHAVRDIRQGEEITICYLASRRNRRARQAELRKNFDFTCACQLCSLPSRQSIENDMKLDRIHSIDSIIDSASVAELVSSAARLLRYVDQQIQLLSEHTPDTISLARAYPDAIRIAAANSDYARVRIFAERLESLYLTTMGEDSPDRMQCIRLIGDPTTHDYWGSSKQWKTSMMDVPVLEDKDFEDWLWRR